MAVYSDSSGVMDGLSVAGQKANTKTEVLSRPWQEFYFQEFLRLFLAGVSSVRLTYSLILGPKFR